MENFGMLVEIDNLASNERLDKGIIRILIGI